MNLCNFWAVVFCTPECWVLHGTGGIFCISIPGLKEAGMKIKAGVGLLSPLLADYPANAMLLPMRLGQKNIYCSKDNLIHELHIFARSYKVELG